MATLIYEKHQKIVRLILNRPHHLNALNEELLDEMAEGLRRFDEDEESWVAIISGEGRAFSAGADIRGPLWQSGGKSRGRRRSGDLLLDPLENSKPVIVAVHGYAFGAAMSIALDADLLIADTTAKFQISEVRRGIDGSVVWTKACLKANGSLADELALTGRVAEAREAFQWGLVNRLAEEGQHIALAREAAQELLSLPPLAVRAIVRSRRVRSRQAVAAVREQTSHGRLAETADFREASAALREKREPVFRAM